MPDQYPYQQPYRDPYGQQYQDPYGQSHHEGSVEEHIHRTVNKRVDHSRTPVRDLFTPSAWASGKAGAISGIAGVMLAAAALALFFMGRFSEAGQISQMRQQIAAMSQQFRDAQDANASGYNGLSGKINAMGQVVTGLAPYTLVCAQALETQAGPGTYFFPCSPVKP